MLQLNIRDEVSRLRAVVLGRADENGPVPTVEETYDPKSAKHIKQGTYPTIPDMVKEMEAVNKVFEKYDVEVYRPKLIQDYNQIFTRDIAFVIEDKFIIGNILEDRSKEIDAIEYLISKINPENVIRFPEEAHVEGGDVMPWGDYIFVGTYKDENYRKYITARTNMKAVEELQKLFPKKKVKSFSLRKSNSVPKENALHLDCCFQPLGKGKAIIHKNSFLIEEEYQWLVDFFGKENLFEITDDEMTQMFSNVVSITPDVVLSEQKFYRLNDWLRQQGFTVEEVPYAEISKQSGLLRCSTLPLLRE
ncbi:MAG TPA: arginine deiminase family protein [Flavobacteriaceae bacterium]|nr:arginine deiminase family protein [Flavobacteriaceae bacterium]